MNAHGDGLIELPLLVVRLPIEKQPLLGLTLARSTGRHLSYVRVLCCVCGVSVCYVCVSVRCARVCARDLLYSVFLTARDDTEIPVQTSAISKREGEGEGE